ncbi:hypothetical protein [Parapedobacter sp. 2B3]|uniref:hypothetical protein n=1 Tax=Parapedobacter sp. 2B3 TaxID=3342381 RepID=UPI0035B66F78
MGTGSGEGGGYLTSLLLMKIKRICIRSNEVAALLGVDQKQGQRKLRQLKILLGKEDRQYVTFKEFAEYSGIPLDELLDACQLP